MNIRWFTKGEMAAVRAGKGWPADTISRIREAKIQAGNLDQGVSNTTDPSKRGFEPK